MDYITSYGKLLFVLINWCDWKKEKRKETLLWSISKYYSVLHIVQIHGPYRSEPCSASHQSMGLFKTVSGSVW